MNDSSEASGTAEDRSTPYAQIGGDAAVRALVDRFYDLMDREPAYTVIRKLHAADLANARDKLYWYLSGWLGGPNRYIERFGHPMLRGRHLPFPVGVAERDAWMACMTQAMRETQVPAALHEALVSALFRTADWMRNRPD
jgi:hemoglobin